MSITFEDQCTKLPDDLYELQNEYSWIKDIMYEYNKNGFLTYTSQPGKSTNNHKLYKSYWHAKYKDETDSKTAVEHIRKQRAYVRGYMHRDMANYVIGKIKGDLYLRARSTDHNSVLDDCIKLGSVMFISSEPVAKEMLYAETDIGKKEIPDYDGSFNMTLELRRPFSLLFPNVLDEAKDIVEFDIIDIRWNDNTHLWKTLLDAILEFKTMDK
jgi:hypothetical protein